MKQVAPEHGQSAQRVKVGMIGLAAVILLIGLASALFSLINREAPVDAAGAAKGEVVANLAATTNQMIDGTREPLAELGVAPGAAIGNSAAPPPAPSPAPAPRPGGAPAAAAD